MAIKGEVLIEKIIKEQELVIGPLAWREADKVEGLIAKKDKGVSVKGNVKDILSDLVEQYEGLFGPASVEVCREAVQPLLADASKSDIPDALK